jgi:hypothetical protein
LVILSEAKNLLFIASKKQILRPAASAAVQAETTIGHLQKQLWGISNYADLVILSEAKNLLFIASKKQILRPEPAPSVVEGASE